MRCVLPVMAIAVAACASAGSATPADGRNGPDDAASADSPARRIDARAGDDAQRATGDAAIDAPPGSCGDAFTGVLATYSFAGASGSQASTDASSTATGVVAGAISRSAALTATSGAGSINASGWPTAGQLDAQHYYTLSVTPPSGCALDVTSLAVTTQASGTGPKSASVATSADAFAAATTMSPNGSSTPALAVSGATSAVELRLYGYAATGTSGTMRVTALTVSGSIH